MGGAISLNARDDGESGARVQITLPSPPQTTTIRRDGVQSPQLLDILVVDDEPLVAELLRDAIEEQGYRVHVVDTLAGAKAAIAQQVPSAVLIDVTLPDGDGLDLVRELGQRYPELVGHMALVTGDPKQPAIAGLQRHLGIPVLGKPFRMVEIGEMLERLL